MRQVWTGNAAVGRRIGQWTDDSPTGSWNLVKTADGYDKLRTVGCRPVGGLP